MEDLNSYLSYSLAILSSMHDYPLYHVSSTLQVSTNGIISFGKEFINAGSRLFPSYTIAGIHYSYVLAPYWSDIDTRDRGEVWYETHFRNQNSTSDGLLDQVSSFINNQTDASAFIGTLMIVVKWDSVPPYTGEGGFSPTVSVSHC